MTRCDSRSVPTVVRRSPIAWVRLCDAVDLLAVTPAQACAWVEDGTLRSVDSPVGLWVLAEDVLEIERRRVWGEPG